MTPTFLGLTPGQWIVALLGFFATPIITVIGIAVRREKDLTKIQERLVANNKESIERYEKNKERYEKLSEAVQLLQNDHAKLAAMAESIEWIKASLIRLESKL